MKTIATTSAKKPHASRRIWLILSLPGRASAAGADLMSQPIQQNGTRQFLAGHVRSAPNRSAESPEIRLERFCLRRQVGVRGKAMLSMDPCENVRNSTLVAD